MSSCGKEIRENSGLPTGIQVAKIDNSSTTDPFRSAWWCPGPHLQTLWPQLSRRLPRLRYQREVLDLPDGDFVDVDWIHHNNPRAIAILIHGLGGHSRSPYIRGLAHRLNTAGYRIAALNMRGASGRPNRRPRTYHSGHTEDLDYLIRQIKTRFTATPIVCVGYSLGGNLLLKWLGEYPEKARIKAAAAVSVPFLLGQTADRMNRGFSKIYQYKLLSDLKSSTRLRRRLFKGRINLEAALEAGEFRQFDNALTAPLNGFANAEHYYARCSCRQYLSRIQSPTLIIHSLDDPFMTVDTVPDKDEFSDSIRADIFPKGGHVGFIDSKFPGLSGCWLDKRITEYFDDQLEINRDTG